MTGFVPSPTTPIVPSPRPQSIGFFDSLSPAPFTPRVEYIDQYIQHVQWNIVIASRHAHHPLSHFGMDEPKSLNRTLAPRHFGTVAGSQGSVVGQDES